MNGAAALPGLGAVLLAAGCNPGAAGSPDLRADLRAPADLRACTTGDLRPPGLTGLPMDCAAGVTAAMLYDTEVHLHCATIEGCHADIPSHFSIFSGADLLSRWVTQPSTESCLSYVTPGDVNGSYVLYKLTGQQGKLGPDTGAQMPSNAQPLGHDDLCKFISWVQGGAPP